MHDEGKVETAGELTGRGEVVRVSVRDDKVTDAYAVVVGQCKIAIDLA
jgi:hypothetical protein